MLILEPETWFINQPINQWSHCLWLLGEVVYVSDRSHWLWVERCVLDEQNDKMSQEIRI